MIKSKVETYIGFCIKAGKISLGAGAVEVQKRDVKLIIVSADAAINTQKLAVKFKKRFNCPLVICKSRFGEIVNKEGCKIAAIKDGGLAKAILNNLDDNYELYVGGNF